MVTGSQKLMRLGIERLFFFNTGLTSIAPERGHQRVPKSASQGHAR